MLRRISILAESGQKLACYKEPNLNFLRHNINKVRFHKHEQIFTKIFGIYSVDGDIIFLCP
jgi:hypothetical protein